MTSAARTRYFRLWTNACAAAGWNPKDETRRRAVTSECMRAVRGPAIASSTDLGEDEITALFLYLEFLAAGDADLELSARWLDCRTDYKAYSRARQADWHETQTYGRGQNKLDKNRFAGEVSAAGGPLDKFNPEAIRKRHLTMASRHAAKKKREKETAAPKAPDTPAFPMGGTSAPVPEPKRPASRRATQANTLAVKDPF
jgi:hypothetical protein